MFAPIFKAMVGRVKQGPSAFLLTKILLGDGKLNGKGCSQYLHLLEADNSVVGRLCD